MAVVLLQTLMAGSQWVNSADLSSATSELGSPAEPSPKPEQTAIKIPAALYDKWRKYGQWDYKQQAAKYRDATQFNFGATGAALGLDEQTLVGLARSYRPMPKDIESFDLPGLEANFQRQAQMFDKLRAMAQEDEGVIRIASDFTWLRNDSGWPREDIGFSKTRWEEYRLLFKKLFLIEGIVRTEDLPGAILFVAHARGLCISGSSAGYVFSKGEMGPLTDSPAEALEKEARNNPAKHYAYVFKRLKANWYAFYEMDW